MLGNERQASLLKRVKSQAMVELERGGFNDRSSGAFILPEADILEPARTERLLKSPFTLRRDTVADAFHQRAGFLFFRIHGAHQIGLCCHLSIIVMGLTGVLAGRATLGGSRPSARSQAVAMFAWLAMALVGYCWTPDADRVVNFFVSLNSSLRPSLPSCCCSPTRRRSRPRWSAPDSGFCFSLVALCLPILVLLEQRLITPWSSLCQGAEHPHSAEPCTCSPLA